MFIEPKKGVGETALTDGTHTFSWEALNGIVARAANALCSEPLPEHRRIAVFAQNSAETVLAHLAGLFGSCSVVPVSYHLTAEELAYILEDSGAGVLFVGPETVNTGLEAARQAGLSRVIGWRCQPAQRLTGWHEWLAASSDAPPSLESPPRPNLLYTSGTTGRPKGTELPPTMFAGGANLEEHLTLLKRNPFALMGTHLVVGPLYHTGPLTGVRILAAGVPVVVLRRFDAAAALAAIEENKVETSVMVPTHFIRFLSLPKDEREKHDLSSLKMVFHTGSACPVDVKKAILDWWGPKLYEAYGATEVGTTCTITPFDWLKHPGSVGKPMHPFEVLVVDEEGKEVSARTEGRLYFRDKTGRGIVYHNDPEKSAAAHLEPGVFTLGEIGYVDEDGFVYITDRFSDMVVSGGVNIYPAESEQVLVQHPEIEDIACIGIPNAEMGEELRALIVANDPENPPDARELLAFCRERLAHYKCPRSVEFVSDLGRNALGKLNKKRLKAPYWEQREAG